MPYDEQLKTMLDNIIADNNEQAEVAFHQYLQDKMQEKIHGVEVEDDQGGEEHNED